MLRRIPKTYPGSNAPRVLDLLTRETQATRVTLRRASERQEALRTLLARARLNLRDALRQAANQLPFAPEALSQLLSRELERLGAAQYVTARVHPEDLPLLLESPAIHAQRAELAGALRITKDASLQRGDCVLESDLGDVDARLQTRIESLCAALLAGPHDV